MTELNDIIVYGIIDPVTLGFAISAGSKIIGSMMGPDEDDLKDAVEEAKRVSFAEKQEVGQELNLAQRQQHDKTQSLLKGATSQAQKSLLGLYKTTDTAIASSGFESSDAVNATSSNVREQVYGTHGDAVDDIVAQSNFAKQSTDLNIKKKIDGIENNLDKTMSSILGTPDTFLEKFVGSSDYELG